MDEKGLKKIKEIIDTILELRKADTLTNQGYNDRIGVAKDIYERNKEDVKFINLLEKSISEDQKRVYSRIISSK
jgi:hypothetical protein